MTSCRLEQPPALEGPRYQPGRPPDTSDTDACWCHKESTSKSSSLVLPASAFFIILDVLLGGSLVWNEIRRQMSGAAGVTRAAHAQHVVHGCGSKAKQTHDRQCAHATLSLKNREAASILTSVGDTVLGYTTKRNSQKSRVSVPWGKWMPPFACSSLHHFQCHAVQPLRGSEASLRGPTWCMFVIMRYGEHATELSFRLKFSRSALSKLLVSVKMRRWHS